MVIEHVFRVGDCVRLFGGSPVMRVVAVNGNMIVCGWKPLKSKYREHRFYCDQLEKAEK
jgi:uncharacterized protein YodC (DUF2158 family)